MAGAMKKIGLYLGLVEDDDERHYGHYGADDYDEDYDDAPASRRPAEERGGSVRRYSADRSMTRGSLAVDVAPRVIPSAIDDESESASYRITTLHPRTYNEARTIGEHFREGTPVIINLSEMDDVDAKRLVDFSAGLIFGLRGTIERVTNKVFLLSPQNIDVTAEDKARIAEGGFFNQS